MASSSKMFSPPVLALLAGALMWGVIWYPMRLLEQAGIDGLWLTLLIYLAALVASLPYTYRYFSINTVSDCSGMDQCRFCAGNS